MKPQVVSNWQIRAEEFNVDNILMNLQVLDEGPITLLDYIKE